MIPNSCSRRFPYDECIVGEAVSEKLLSAADITEFGLLFFIPIIGPVDDGRAPTPTRLSTRASMLSLLL